MKASAANFLALIKGPKQFVIPIYQRTYSWQIKQCSKLLSDILRISQDNTTPGHFIGSVVYFQESIHTTTDVPELLVIDGQQRLTTISLLIAAIADYLKDNEAAIDTNRIKLQNYYLMNSEETGDLRYKLLLTQRDKSTYIHLIRGIASPENYSPRITENYTFFRNSINSENIGAIYSGLQRLFVVDVALEKDKDNPQLIFESLNSTGLDLSQADLIRNYVLMGQPFYLQTRLYENYWLPMEQKFGNEYSALFDWFVRDYLTVKTGQIPRIGGVYDAYKSYTQGKKSPDTVEEVVADIFKYAGFYANMVLYKEPNPELNQAFRSIHQLKMDVVYPFFLAVYNDFNSGIIDQNTFLQIAKLSENYVFRRAVCGIPTNSMNKTFSTLYRSIHKERYLESVKAAFQVMDSYRRFPNDTEFKQELLIKNIYNFRSRNYLLSKLENHKRREIVTIEDYTIEHIMPQNPNLSEEWQQNLGENWKEIQVKYLHTLGNLTLTAYNSHLSDRSFLEKKNMEGGFAESPIRLNFSLKGLSFWNEETILNRAKELAEKAAEVWAAPNLPDDVLTRYVREDQKESIDYTLDHYEHLNGGVLEMYQMLRKKILNLDPSVREEYKKIYIAYKLATNFVDVVPAKNKLLLYLNIEFEAIVDPKGLCRDVSEIGHWGCGDVEITLTSMLYIEDVLGLIQQAFDLQVEA